MPSSIIALLVAALSLYYLLQELTIVQILATMFFTASLMVMGAISYSEEIRKMANSLLKNRNIIKKSWLAILVWLIILVWGLFELF